MNGVLTSEDISVESCLKITNETPKMEGVEFIKSRFNKAKIFMEKLFETDFDVRKSILKSLIN